MQKNQVLPNRRRPVDESQDQPLIDETKEEEVNLLKTNHELATTIDEKENAQLLKNDAVVQRIDDEYRYILGEKPDFKPDAKDESNEDKELVQDKNETLKQG